MARGRQFSFQKRLRIYWRDLFTCQYCQTPMHPLSEELTLDHVIPDGGDGDDNLVTACRSCNSAKGNKPVRELLNRRSLLKVIETNPVMMAPAEILNLVARRYSVTVDQIRSSRRGRHLVEARAEIAHRMRDAGYTYAAIASQLGKKDHSTIVHLIKTYPRERLWGLGDKSAH